MQWAFTSRSYIDIHLQVAGIKIKRLVSVAYSYTPPWPYYDPEKKCEVKAEMALDLELEVLARRLPRGSLDDIPESKQVWVSLDGLMVPGLLRPKVYDRLLEYIDEDARFRDCEARKRAGFPLAEAIETI